MGGWPSDINSGHKNEHASLADAQDVCLKSKDCGGVTKQKPSSWQARKGSNPKNSPSGEESWVKPGKGECPGNTGLTGIPYACARKKTCESCIASCKTKNGQACQWLENGSIKNRKGRHAKKYPLCRQVKWKIHDKNRGTPNTTCGSSKQEGTSCFFQ